MTNVKTPFLDTNKSCNIDILNPIDPCKNVYSDLYREPRQGQEQWYNHLLCPWQPCLWRCYTQVAKKFLNFMEPKGLLVSSQVYQQLLS
jgi:hypothetical protein